MFQEDSINYIGAVSADEEHEIPIPHIVNVETPFDLTFEIYPAHKGVGNSKKEVSNEKAKHTLARRIYHYVTCHYTCISTPG
jgi:hypothetical protein